MQRWALIDKGRERSTFIDPANPDAGPIEWVGRWRTLQPSWSFSARWENFSRAWTFLKVPRVLWNTFAIAALGDVGTLIASTLVAYGFARFRFPGRDVLFLVLIATIILPRAITLIPTYAFFVRIGWVGTWLPLIVPHFFANAYNVFLLRQYMLTIPRELDEAAMIDGANPFRILTSVILPQCLPALVAVGLFHFVFAWNDFLEPMVYLSTVQDKQPISIAIQLFNARYFAEPYMVQATSLIGLAVPVLIFLLSQRVFLQGVVITGVEK